MKKRLFDFWVLLIMTIFTIDMVIDKSFAIPTDSPDDLEALIEESEKIIAKTSVMVEKAAKTQQELEKEIIDNITNLQNSIAKNKENLKDIKEATNQISQDLESDPKLMDQVNKFGLHTLIMTRLASKKLDSVSYSKIKSTIFKGIENKKDLEEGNSKRKWSK